MTASELYAILQEELPSIEAIPNDPIGIQVEPPEHRVRHILTCLEVTDEVIEEAIDSKCDCIVTFHPLIYSPLTSIRSSERVSRCIMKAIQHRIAIICVHTTLDAHPEGTNAFIASELDLYVECPLLPPRQHERYGIGIVGTLPVPITTREFAHHIAERLRCIVRYCTGKSNTVKRVAIIAGSGSSLLHEALASGADAFVTGDVKYHTFHTAHGQIALYDAGHFEMERLVPEVLARIIRRVVGEHNITVTACNISTSPIRIEIPLDFETKRSTIVSEQL